MTLFRRCTLAAVLAACITTSSMANDDWWFDVEVVAFKRNTALTQLEEQFNLADSFDVLQTEADLISDVIMPDIRFIKQNLATCDINGQPQKKPLPAWPRDLSLLIPAYDAQFLALGNASLLNNTSALDSIASENTSYNRLENSGALVESTGSDGSDALDNNASRASIKNSEPLDGGVEKRGANNADGTSTDMAALAIREGASYDENSEARESKLAPTLKSIASYWTDINWSAYVNADLKSAVSLPTFTYCESTGPWLSIKQLPGGFQWQQHKVDNKIPPPEQLPVVIEGHDWPLASHAHLLSSDTHELTSISRQIRSNRQLERLLHVAWRQPVEFGKNNAFNVRLFGGTNYADSFDADGEQIQNKRSPSADKEEVINDDVTNTSKDGSQTVNFDSGIFANLERRLSQPDPISFNDLQRLDTHRNLSDESTVNSDNSREQIWEIDGRMKVFLKYINRVPYLHIDSEMFYRHQVPTQYFNNNDISAQINISKSELSENGAENNQNTSGIEAIDYQLVSIPLAEQRRVISNQLHYFDHPLYGFIVQIRRYKRPSQEDSQ